MKFRIVLCTISKLICAYKSWKKRVKFKKVYKYRQVTQRLIFLKCCSKLFSWESSSLLLRYFINWEKVCVLYFLCYTQPVWHFYSYCNQRRTSAFFLVFIIGESLGGGIYPSCLCTLYTLLPSSWGITLLYRSYMGKVR